ncbi:MAG TPA: AraC family transcriptional regulator [Acidimicrobiia bacterium]|nr:AraC family transcriptional regulator [Acidimicrobiia bacterium]
MTDVALRWGFADTAHFSRSFRSQYGISPTEAIKLRTG